YRRNHAAGKDKAPIARRAYRGAMLRQICLEAAYKILVRPEQLSTPIALRPLGSRATATLGALPVTSICTQPSRATYRGRYRSKAVPLTIHSTAGDLRRGEAAPPGSRLGRRPRCGSDIDHPCQQGDGVQRGVYAGSRYNLSASQ